MYVRITKLTLIALWCLLGASSLAYDLIVVAEDYSFFRAWLQFGIYIFLILVGFVAIKKIIDS